MITRTTVRQFYIHFWSSIWAVWTRIWVFHHGQYTRLWLPRGSACLASFPGSMKRGEGLVHTACACAGGLQKNVGVLDIMLSYIPRDALPRRSGACVSSVYPGPLSSLRRAWERARYALGLSSGRCHVQLVHHLMIVQRWWASGSELTVS